MTGYILTGVSVNSFSSVLLFCRLVRLHYSRPGLTQGPVTSCHLMHPNPRPFFSHRSSISLLPLIAPKVGFAHRQWVHLYIAAEAHTTWAYLQVHLATAAGAKKPHGPGRVAAARCVFGRYHAHSSSRPVCSALSRLLTEADPRLAFR